jgi:apolipoprotein D and lipocalin family protein
MHRKIIIIALVAAGVIAGCTAIPEDLKPVTGFEADRYLGTWYEIARLDHRFERHLNNISATYTRGANGEILVVNRGFDVKNNQWKQIEGRALFLGDETVGSLKVSFVGPFYGGYHVIALDKQDYSFAMVTGPSRSYLWILSRSKTLDESIYADLISKAGKWGFDTKKLIMVEHNLPKE